MISAPQAPTVVYNIERLKGGRRARRYEVGTTDDKRGAALVQASTEASAGDEIRVPAGDYRVAVTNWITPDVTYHFAAGARVYKDTASEPLVILDGGNRYHITGQGQFENAASTDSAANRAHAFEIKGTGTQAILKFDLASTSTLNGAGIFATGTNAVIQIAAREVRSDRYDAIWIDPMVTGLAVDMAIALVENGRLLDSQADRDQSDGIECAGGTNILSGQVNVQTLRTHGKALNLQVPGLSFTIEKIELVDNSQTGQGQFGLINGNCAVRIGRTLHPTGKAGTLTLGGASNQVSCDYLQGDLVLGGVTENQFTATAINGNVTVGADDLRLYCPLVTGDVKTSAPGTQRTVRTSTLPRVLGVIDEVRFAVSDVRVTTDTTVSDWNAATHRTLRVDATQNTLIQLPANIRNEDQLTILFPPYTESLTHAFTDAKFLNQKGGTFGVTTVANEWTIIDCLVVTEDPPNERILCTVRGGTWLPEQNSASTTETRNDITLGGPAGGSQIAPPTEYAVRQYLQGIEPPTLIQLDGTSGAGDADNLQQIIDDATGPTMIYLRGQFRLDRQISVKKDHIYIDGRWEADIAINFAGNKLPGAPTVAHFGNGCFHFGAGLDSRTGFNGWAGGVDYSKELWANPTPAGGSPEGGGFVELPGVVVAAGSADITSTELVNLQGGLQVGDWVQLISSENETENAFQPTPCGRRGMFNQVHSIDGNLVRFRFVSPFAIPATISARRISAARGNLVTGGGLMRCRIKPAAGFERSAVPLTLGMIQGAIFSQLDSRDGSFFARISNSFDCRIIDSDLVCEQALPRNTADTNSPFAMGAMAAAIEIAGCTVSGFQHGFDTTTFCQQAHHWSIDVRDSRFYNCWGATLNTHESAGGINFRNCYVETNWRDPDTNQDEGMMIRAPWCTVIGCHFNIMRSEQDAVSGSALVCYAGQTLFENNTVVCNTSIGIRTADNLSGNTQSGIVFRNNYLKSIGAIQSEFPIGIYGGGVDPLYENNTFDGFNRPIHVGRVGHQTGTRHRYANNHWVNNRGTFNRPAGSGLDATSVFIGNEGLQDEEAVAASGSTITLDCIQAMKRFNVDMSGVTGTAALQLPANAHPGYVRTIYVTDLAKLTLASGWRIAGGATPAWSGAGLLRFEIDDAGAAHLTYDQQVAAVP